MIDLFDFDQALAFVQNTLGKASGFPYDLYQDQRYALIETLTAFKSGNFDNVIIVAPTDSGKSGIAMGLALAAMEQQVQTMLLTPTRNLQNQVVKSFSKIKDLRSFKGRGNYPCLLFGDDKTTANNADCADYDTAIDADDLKLPFQLTVNPPKTDHADLDTLTMRNAERWLNLDTDERWEEMEEFMFGKPVWKSQMQTSLCTEKQICPYRVARDHAQEAMIAILNLKAYFMWNILAKESPYFKPRPFTVFDECHTVEDNARDYYTLHVSDKGLHDLYRKVLGAKALAEVEISFTNIKTQQQVNELLPVLLDLNVHALKVSMRKAGLEGRFGEYAALAEDAGENSTPSKLIRYHKLFKLACDPKSSFVKQILHPEQNKDIKTPTLVIQSVDLPPAFQTVYGMYNVFMSATVADVDVFCRSLCLDRKRTQVVTLPDHFPIEHRPIVPLPIVNVNYKELQANPNGVYGEMSSALDTIAKAFPTHKTLVHTSSYVFGKELHARLNAPVHGRVLCPQNGDENKAAIEMYANPADRRPHILISPACREGYDFEGEICRVQVFTKCPFPSMKDPVVEKKLQTRGGRAWYAAKVATALRQQYGRSTRHAEDFSITFFLDIGLIGFVNKNARLFPMEFHKAMELGKRLDWQKVEITHQLSVDGEKISY